MLANDDRRINRREALGAGLAVTGALAFGLGRNATAAPADGPSPYGPFKMGLQSYSLRGFTKDGKPDIDRALVITRELGLHYWEAFPAHIQAVTDAPEAERIKRHLTPYGVTLIGYGVSHFSKDHEANRKLFAFAKLMDLGYLSADPDPDSFESLDKLTEQYGIPIGIHNHGPGHRYDTIEKIQAAIKDHSPKIGCCVDTGHFLRSKVDPVQAVEAFGPRVYGVHLKDVKNSDTFTELGKGDLRTADLLKLLAKNKYDYALALEYEEHEDDPVAEIRECLVAVQEALKSAGIVGTGRVPRNAVGD